jgi:hypothetical protein
MTQVTKKIRSFPARAPYVEEIKSRAQDLMRRYGGKVDVREIVLGTRGSWDEATLIVLEEPVGLMSLPGLAGEEDKWYAGKVARFIYDSPGYYWVEK